MSGLSGLIAPLSRACASRFRDGDHKATVIQAWPRRALGLCVATITNPFLLAGSGIPVFSRLDGRRKP